METNMLKEYLRHVYELEVSLYNQRRVYEKIGRKIREYENVAYEREITYHNDKIDSKFIEDNFKEKFLPSVIGGSVVGIVVWLAMALAGFVSFSRNTAVYMVLVCIAIPYVILTVYGFMEKRGIKRKIRR